MQDVAEDEARAQQDDAGLQPELVGGYAGLKDLRQADGIRDEHANQDCPKHVFDVGQDQVVRLAIACDRLLDELARIADHEQQTDSRQKPKNAVAVGVFTILLQRQG